jgi:hypothetical protein
MKLSLLFPVVLLACSGADPSGVDPSISADSNDEAIVGGVLDRGAHPAVIAIDIAGQGLCTGTLVAPDVVLTARHCVSYTKERVECAPNEVLGDRDPTTLAIHGGPDVYDAPLLARGRRLVVPSGRTLCDHDVAAIVLDRVVKNVRPIDVATAAPKVGDSLVVVGFGRTGPSGAAGVKRRRTVPILGVSARELEVGEVTCPGDSGGPALDVSGDVVGVVSRGRAFCAGRSATNVFTRVDVVRSLIAEAKRAR